MNSCKHRGRSFRGCDGNFYVRCHATEDDIMCDECGAGTTDPKLYCKFYEPQEENEKMKRKYKVTFTRTETYVHTETVEAVDEMNAIEQVDSDECWEFNKEPDYVEVESEAKEVAS